MTPLMKLASELDLKLICHLLFLKCDFNVSEQHWKVLMTLLTCNKDTGHRQLFVSSHICDVIGIRMEY